MESIKEILEEDVEIIAPGALELLERAQIDMQIATAKKYPRDIVKVKRRMIEFATLDEETAEACFYTLPRAGKHIQGPSVRLAEIAMACYGNVNVGARVIDADGTTTTSQGVCHDLENNVRVTIESKRRITDSKGKRYNEDMIVVTGNAAASIALRNAVFRVIPMALIKPVYQAAMKVAVGDASTIATTRAKIFSRLNQMQVTNERILARLGKSGIEGVGLDDIATLIGLGTAIKDGETTVDDAFPPLEGTVEDQKKVANEKINSLRNKASSTQATATDATKAEGKSTAPAQSDAAAGDPAASQTGTAAPSAPEKKEPEIPLHILDLRAWRETLGGEVFATILGAHGFEAIKDVPAEAFPPIQEALLLAGKDRGKTAPASEPAKEAAKPKLRFGDKKQ